MKWLLLVLATATVALAAPPPRNYQHDVAVFCRRARAMAGNGYFPKYQADPADPEVFYVCVFGTMMQFSARYACPTNTVWKQGCQRCTHKNFPCPDEPPEPEEKPESDRKCIKGNYVFKAVSDKEYTMADLAGKATSTYTCEGDKPYFSRDLCACSARDTDGCSLSSEIGPCEAAMIRYHYNPVTQQCEIFQYSGCEGNRNNFRTEELCMEACKEEEQETEDSLECQRGDKIYTLITRKTFMEKDTTKGTSTTYNCPAYAPYFSVDQCSCVTDSVQPVPKGVILGEGECYHDNHIYFAKDHKAYRKISIGREDYVDELCPLEAPYFGRMACQCVDTAEPSLEQQPGEICSLPPEVGPCDGDYTRYYYNPDTEQCEQFQYGGCDGNENNFMTERDCLDACGGAAGYRSCYAGPFELKQIGEKEYMQIDMSQKDMSVTLQCEEDTSRFDVNICACMSDPPSLPNGGMPKSCKRGEKVFTKLTERTFSVATEPSALSYYNCPLSAPRFDADQCSCVTVMVEQVPDNVRLVEMECYHDNYIYYAKDHKAYRKIAVDRTSYTDEICGVDSPYFSQMACGCVAEPVQEAEQISGEITACYKSGYMYSKVSEKQYSQTRQGKTTTHTCDTETPYFSLDVCDCVTRDDPFATERDESTCQRDSQIFSLKTETHFTVENTDTGETLTYRCPDEAPNFSVDQCSCVTETAEPVPALVKLGLDECYRDNSVYYARDHKSYWRMSATRWSYEEAVCPPETPFFGIMACGCVANEESPAELVSEDDLPCYKGPYELVKIGDQEYTQTDMSQKGLTVTLQCDGNVAQFDVGVCACVSEEDPSAPVEDMNECKRGEKLFTKLTERTFSVATEPSALSYYSCPLSAPRFSVDQCSCVTDSMEQVPAEVRLVEMECYRDNYVYYAMDHKSFRKIAAVDRTSYRDEICGVDAPYFSQMSCGCVTLQPEEPEQLSEEITICHKSGYIYTKVSDEEYSKTRQGKTTTHSCDGQTPTFSLDVCSCVSSDDPLATGGDMVTDEWKCRRGNELYSLVTRKLFTVQNLETGETLKYQCPEQAPYFAVDQCSCVTASAETVPALVKLGQEECYRDNSIYYARDYKSYWRISSTRWSYEEAVCPLDAPFFSIMACGCVTNQEALIVLVPDETPEDVQPCYKGAYELRKVSDKEYMQTDVTQKALTVMLHCQGDAMLFDVTVCACVSEDDSGLPTGGVNECKRGEKLFTKLTERTFSVATEPSALSYYSCPLSAPRFDINQCSCVTDSVDQVPYEVRLGIGECYHDNYIYYGKDHKSYRSIPVDRTSYTDEICGVSAPYFSQMACGCVSEEPMEPSSLEAEIAACYKSGYTYSKLSEKQYSQTRQGKTMTHTCDAETPYFSLDVCDCVTNRGQNQLPEQDEWECTRVTKLYSLMTRKQFTVLNLETGETLKYQCPEEAPYFAVDQCSCVTDSVEEVPSLVNLGLGECYRDNSVYYARDHKSYWRISATRWSYEEAVCPLDAPFFSIMACGCVVNQEASAVLLPENTPQDYLPCYLGPYELIKVSDREYKRVDMSQKGLTVLLQCQGAASLFDVTVCGCVGQDSGLPNGGAKQDCQRGDTVYTRLGTRSYYVLVGGVAEAYSCPDSAPNFVTDQCSCVKATAQQVPTEVRLGAQECYRDNYVYYAKDHKSYRKIAVDRTSYTDEICGVDAPYFSQMACGCVTMQPAVPLEISGEITACYKSGYMYSKLSEKQYSQTRQEKTTTHTCDTETPYFSVDLCACVIERDNPQPSEIDLYSCTRGDETYSLVTRKQFTVNGETYRCPEYAPYFTTDRCSCVTADVQTLPTTVRLAEGECYRDNSIYYARDHKSYWRISATRWSYEEAVCPPEAPFFGIMACGCIANQEPAIILVDDTPVDSGEQEPDTDVPDGVTLGQNECYRDNYIYTFLNDNEYSITDLNRKYSSDRFCDPSVPLFDLAACDCIPDQP